MSPPIDLPCDLNAEDDDGLNWALLARATDPSSVLPDAVLVAGLPRFWSVVRVTSVDPDGQVHFVPLDDDDPAARQLIRRVGASEDASSCVLVAGEERGSTSS